YFVGFTHRSRTWRLLWKSPDFYLSCFGSWLDSIMCDPVQLSRKRISNVPTCTAIKKVIYLRRPLSAKIIYNCNVQEAIKVYVHHCELSPERINTGVRAYLNHLNESRRGSSRNLDSANWMDRIIRSRVIFRRRIAHQANSIRRQLPVHLKPE